MWPCVSVLQVFPSNIPYKTNARIFIGNLKCLHNRPDKLLSLIKAQLRDAARCVNDKREIRLAEAFCTETIDDNNNNGAAAADDNNNCNFRPISRLHDVRSVAVISGKAHNV